MPGHRAWGSPMVGDLVVRLGQRRATSTPLSPSPCGHHGHATLVRPPVSPCLPATAARNDTSPSSSIPSLPLLLQINRNKRAKEERGPSSQSRAIVGSLWLFEQNIAFMDGLLLVVVGGWLLRFRKGINNQMCTGDIKMPKK